MISAALAAGLALTMTVTAFADEPYTAYNYDYWDDAIPSQSAYRVEKTVTGADMGLDRLSDPSDPLYISDDAPAKLSDAKDLFYDQDNDTFWVCDSGNNRILRLDTDLKVTGCYTGFTGSTEISVGEDGRSTFLNPNGIYVKKSIFDDKLYVYIADTDNSRAVKCTVESGTEMTLVQEYTKPDTKLYDSETFNPSKILADKAENIYVVCKSVNTGSVQFNKDGEFQGFYGANRVEVTAAVVAQKLWRKIASNEQISAMTRNVPVEYANFDIDADGFIYTVTEAANTTTDAVKKLNPAGYNIWDNAVGDEYSFGDVASEYDSTTNKTYKCRLTDICVSDNGTINVLDYENGRVFQYDKLCNLLCIFGTKNSTSDQAGSFLGPNAIEARGNEVYILDGTKNDITVYTETTFGNVVHRAVLLYDEGRYSDARADWEEVIKRDGGYAMAYVGLGKACLNDGEYMKALDYFKTAYDQDDYDKAFKYAREEWLRDNFTVIMIVIIVLIVLLIVKAVLKKKGIKLIKRKRRRETDMYEFTPVGWLKHCVFHPVEGFEDLRWKKQGSMKISMLIVLFLFIAMVVDRQLTGFQFNDSYVKVFNVVPLIVQSVVYFFTWVLGNWAICTLLDGEGTLKKICIYSAYSLVPYIVCTFIAVIFSNVLVQDESIWITAIQYLGIGWSVILMVQAMRAVHQYSFGKHLLQLLVRSSQCFLYCSLRYFSFHCSSRYMYSVTQFILRSCTGSEAKTETVV